MHPAKLLIIGFDGLDHELVERYQSDMPNLSGLVANGDLRLLSSTYPPITPGAWTTIFSGVNPGRSGILGFFYRQHGAFVPVALKPPPVRGLWDFCEEQACSCGIVNIPWPGPLPENVLFGVSGRFTALQTSPPNLRDKIIQMGYKPEVFHHTDFTSLSRFLRFTFEQASACTNVSTRLIETYRPDVCAVVYNIPDMALHAMLSEKMIRRVYTEIDKTIGELLPFGERHIVVSDHGINIVKAPVFYLGEWLVREGFLSITGDSAPLTFRGKLGSSLRSWMHRLGLTAWKKKVPQFLRVFLPSGIQDPGSLLVDPEKTRVFLAPSEFCELYLNLQGREEKGFLMPGEAQSVLAEIAQRLEEASNQKGLGRILLTPIAEVYHGEEMDQLPDAVVTDQGRWHLDPGLSPTGPIGPVDIKHEHNQQGVFLMARGTPTSAPAERTARLVDVLPSALALAGLKIPVGLDGRCLSVPAADTKPPYYETTLRREPARRKAVSAEDEAEVMERLRKLGYI